MDRFPDVKVEQSTLEVIPSKGKDNLDIVADLEELREELPVEDDSPFVMPPTREEVKEKKQQTIPVKEVIERKIEKRLKEKYEPPAKPTPLQKAKTTRRRGRPRKEPEPEPEEVAVAPKPKTKEVKEAEIVHREIARSTDDFDDFVKKMDRYEKMKKEAFVRKQKEDEERQRKEKELEEHYYRKFKKQQEEAKQFVEVPTPKKEKPTYGMYDNYF